MSRRTEERLPQLDGFDAWSGADVLAALLDGQRRAIEAVGSALPAIASAAERIAANLDDGGRLVYAGAGASIRLAVQDGAELPATFGMARGKIAYLIAGGPQALIETMADSEDDAEAARRDAASLALTAADSVIAAAASGTTPYTVAALEAAKSAGAYCVAMVNNANAPLSAHAHQEILLDSGPEVIAGSTRLGAGTAQKAAFNLLSTLVHVRLGAVHDGYMVNLDPGNAKLAARSTRIVAAIAKVPEERAAAALKKGQGRIKTAVLLCRPGMGRAEAEDLLREASGNLRLAMGRFSASS